jgi:DNA helicase-2/ATP-dependent DNA helicase PcrA
MENLAVFFHNPTAQVIAKAKDWFGEDNILQL